MSSFVACDNNATSEEKGRRKELHPLFNPIILQKIFSRVQVNTLKNARLVCKQWDKIAAPHLQSNSEVVLIRGKELDKRKYSYRNFISYIENIPEDEIFFRNFHIEHWIVNEKREKSLVTFWQKCGLWMKELNLKDIIFYEIDTIRNVLYHWTPNLESLVIEDCLFYTITQENIPSQCEEYWNPEDFDEEYVFFDYYDHVTVEQLKKIDKCTKVPCNLKLKKLVYEQLEEEALPLAWNEIFSAFSNIKELRISASTPAKQITDILEHLHKSRCENITFANIDNLSFYKNGKGSSSINDSHFQQLTELNLPLSVLEIYLSNTWTEGLFKLLSKHAKSLHFLALSDAQENDTQDDQEDNLYSIFIKNSSLMTFNNLRRLRISLNLVGDLFSRSPQKIIPKLQSIEMWDAENDFNWDTSADKIITKYAYNPLIQEFSCGYLMKSPECFRVLSNSFINLKILKASMKDEQIRVVFQNMKNLEEIYVFDRYLSDEGITGIPILLSETTEWCPSVQRQHPYIGDLPKLRQLCLKYWKYDTITDISVYHGFMDVVNLSHLHLPITSISDTALKDLTFKFSLITLISPTVSKGI